LAPRSSAPEIEVTVLAAMDPSRPGMPAPVRGAVSERLRAAGVETRTGQQVERIGPDQVETGEDGRFPADLTVWATGRVGPPVAGDIDALATNKKRQWIVSPTLQATASEAVFALGDCAYIEEDPAPPNAQAASEQATHLARQLPRFLMGEQPENFSYQDKGTLLSLGEGGT